MSTRCWVGQKRDDGKIYAFYCHCDGYEKFPGVGYTLSVYYSEKDKVTSLVDKCILNGTFSISKNVEETEKELYKNGISLPIFEDESSFVENIPFDIENIFLYKDGKWKVFRGDKGFKNYRY